MPPPHRRLDVGQPEAPVATEESGVIDDGLESALGDQDDVVDEHPLHLGVAKYPAVTRRSGHGIGLTGVVRERDEGRHQHGHRSGEWAAQTNAYGPPPERPTTPNRSAPRASATCATSVAQSATDS